MAIILIVDDRPANREFLVTLLGYGGHRLLEAGDGAEGLAVVQAERPDLVIADILMPTMDGYEFVHQLRTDPVVAGTRVIFFTAHYHEPEARRLAAACGVTDVLTKPCEPEVVLRTVEAALGHTTAPAPGTAQPAEEFDRKHVHLLTDQLSRQADEARRTNERLTALVELGLQLGSERDPARLLQVFCNAAREIVGARYAVVGVPDSTGAGYRHLLTSGMDLALSARVGRPAPLGGLLGSVLGAGRCFRTANHGRLDAAGVPPSFPQASALLAAPIVSPARVYGWVCLLDKLGSDAFTDEDERIARMLAAQVGRIYENGSLYADLLRHSSKLAAEVAERERSEAALRESEGRFRLLAEAMPQIVWAAGPDGQPTYLNRRWTQYTGLDDAWEGDTAQIIHPDDRPAVDAAWERARATQEPYQVEFRMRPAGEGDYRWFLSRAVPIVGPDGAVREWFGTSTDIDDLKRAEAAAAQQLARLQAVVSTMADGLIVSDPGGTLLDWNPAALRMHGYDSVEEVRRHLSDFATTLVLSRPGGPPLPIEEWPFPRILRGETLTDYELEVHRTDTGRRLVIEYSGALVPGPDGRPEQAVLNLHDVTDRRRAEEDLRRTGDLLRAVARGTTDAVFVKDRDGKYLFFNEAASRFVGRPVAETLGKDDTELFDPAGARTVMVRDRQVMASGLTEIAEETLTAAGVTRTFLATKGPYRDAGGSVIGVIGISHDITERKQAERRLAAQFAVVSLLAEATDLSGVAPMLLRVVCETLGWDVGDLWVVDREAGALSCVGVWHVDGVAVTEFVDLTRQTTFARGFGLPGRVWAARQPVWVANVTADPGFIRADAAAGAGLRSGFGFPVLFGNEMLGVAEFFSRDTRPPDDELFRTFESLGSQLGQFLERKRAEDGLRLFRTLIDRATDAIEVVDPGTGRFLDMNERACVAHGYTRDEYLRLSVPDVDPTVAPRPWREIMADLRATGFRPFESVHRRKDGTTFPVEINLSLIRLDRDYLVAVLRDITDRKRAEEDLRLRDRAMRAVSQGILIADANQPDNPLVYVSPGFEKITGYTAAEVIGRNCRFLQAPDTDPDALSQLRAAIRNGEPCRVELRNARKDGSPFWNELSLSPIRDDAGRLTHFVGVQTDVTARRSLEEQFHQAQKMEAVGRLAGGVAHDFNNLLTIINGYSDLMLMELPKDHPFQKFVAPIRDAGERATRLTQQLLAFSRKAIVEPKWLDLNALITESVRLLRRLIGEDIVIVVVADPTLRTINVDPGQIEQLIMNLMVNARDAMPTGGRLTLETRCVTIATEPLPRHSRLEPGHYVQLSVTDTGTGMAEDVKAKIFEPFFTTKEVGKGTGLGLAVVHGVMTQCGGHIDVDSAVGVGTTFTLWFPSPPAPTAGGDGNHAHAPSSGTETVLLVEDEDDVRRIARLALETQGYRVLEAGRGVDAIRMAQDHSGPIEILVSDVVMPEMGGRELAKVLRQVRPGLRVLYMSGYIDDEVVRHGIVEATDAFLQKPFSPLALARKVRVVLDRRQ